MRLIDADELDNAFTDLRWCKLEGASEQTLAHWGDRKDWCLHGSEVEKLIDEAPTIDPVKHGRWVHDKEESRDYIGFFCVQINYDEKWRCSKCNYTVDDEPLWNYCPNCGALMSMDEVKK